MTKRKHGNAVTAAQKVIRETFDGIPIEDAKVNFSLIVRADDIKAAKGHEKDFFNCVLAKACARQVGSRKAAFMKSCAYVEMPDAKGRKRLVRYKLDKEAAAIVDAFDRGKEVRGEVMVTLKAPTASHTLDAVHRRYTKLKKAKRQAILRGQIVAPNKSKSRRPSKASVRRMDVRNGTGMVQHVLKAKR